MQLESFQLIDRLLDLDIPAGRVRCGSTVSPESVVFEAHFPGFPIVPGVLLIELMAQVSGLLVVLENGFERMPFLCKVRKASMRRFVVPGDSLEVSGERIEVTRSYAEMRARIRSGTSQVADAQLFFRCARFPTPETRNACLRYMEVLRSKGQRS